MNVNKDRDLIDRQNLQVLMHSGDEETLVEDARAGMRPAQRVDQKLVTALQSSAVCLSHLHALRKGGGRGGPSAPNQIPER